MVQAAERQWRDRTFADALDWAVRTHGSRLAVVSGDTRLTFAELVGRARAFARGLLAHGVRPGDRVALWAPDGIEWLVARWAVPAMGAVLVPVNTRFRDQEIGYLLRQCGARALIMAGGFGTVSYVDILRDVVPDLDAQSPDAWSSHALPALSLLVGFGEGQPEAAVSFAEVEAAGHRLLEQDDVLARAAAAIAPDDVAQIMYTSGTTSFPKGAMVCHGPLLQNNFNTIARMALGPEDRYLAAVPLFSATGTSFTLSPFLAGAAIVLLGRFSAERFCALAEAEGVTMSFYLEPIVQDLRAFDGLARYDLSHLRTGTGAPLSAGSFRWLVESLGVEGLTNVYGLSETSNAVCRSFWNEPLDDRIESCGLPMPGVALRIVDIDDGRVLPPGEVGEIQVSGYTVMRGYFDMPEETAGAIGADGWLHTGDLGALREDGRLLFKGRVKEMIKPAGFNVATLEVEQFVRTLPAVREAVLVGVPDERLGEAGFLYVQLEDGAQIAADDIVEHCRRHIAGYKVPRYVEFTRDWPLTASGKIRKLDLKERAAAGLAKSRQQSQPRSATGADLQIAENNPSV